MLKGGSTIEREISGPFPFLAEVGREGEAVLHVVKRS